MARNSYFRFKQFTVQQDRCAMKVCTDACAFGAWANNAGAKRILDIGTGTGLLSLMAAQRNPAAQIEAVEIDEDAARQALENVQNSPFASRISLFQTAVQDFNPNERYDSILVNPPFFQNDLRSPDPKINRAQHAATLTFPELLESVNRLLKPQGTWHILLPIEESNQLKNSALTQGWFMQDELVLYHSVKHQPFRLMRSFSRTKNENQTTHSENLAIYEPESSNHTLAFRQLLRDFYLKF
ncbi:tRNA1(Val) (adenine(37)-N6)-methyltransferase [Persicitalea jodogahamensis]|uniref:tRNA1(Val) (adenine(37)-N6)-methyltransferase n=1 Tax=Persicitalea jodogahamensis TaxID=402147 RepID=A0A8J3D7N5_9BACT|nr:methyltransferase [Persicitalea jodogahamensis]GHB64845.1 tRNA1(Val) (adenine(37)-N6)-methyltransferase [Persicitalea jodogahamensis]